MQIDGYTFTTDWFTGHIPNWSRVFKDHVGKKPKVLEIGSFEGRSTVWLIEQMSRFHYGGLLYCVDPWVSSDYVLETLDMVQAEDLFKQNIQLATQRFPNTDVKFTKQFSAVALPHLLGTMAGLFDFIYIDGDHSSPGALTDLVMAHLLCKKGGIIAVDDYLWDHEGSILNGPKLGIDAFSNVFANETTQLRYIPVYQVFFQKKV